VDNVPKKRKIKYSKLEGGKAGTKKKSPIRSGGKNLGLGVKKCTHPDAEKGGKKEKKSTAQFTQMQ